MPPAPIAPVSPELAGNPDGTPPASPGHATPSLTEPGRIGMLQRYVSTRGRDSRSATDLGGHSTSVRELALGRYLASLVPPSTTGLVIAFFAYLISVQPSLLPRYWYWQAVVSGLLMTAGYALGAVLGASAAWVWEQAEVKLSANSNWVKWLSRLGILAATLIAVSLVLRAYRMNLLTSALVGLPALGPQGYLAATFAALVIFACLMGLWHLLVVIWRFIASKIRRFVPRWVATLTATVVVIALVIPLSSDVIFRGIMEYMYHWGANLNRSDPGVSAPLEPQRSGSTGSFMDWDTMGHYGKKFVSFGPRANDITNVTGREAQEPIRIYASLPDNRKLQDAADQVVREMVRTGALDRPVLVIATTTGTGWLEEWSIQSLEYLTDGNCATVSMQYSYVPSIVAFLWEFNRASEAGQILFDTVMEAVNARPPQARPAVYVTGVSLGAAGSQAAFTDGEDLNSKVDGAIWAGTPNYSPLWQLLTTQRHRGTPQVAPVVENGRHIRFANDPSQLRVDINGRTLPTWEYPRSVFLQHASDPVVWWSPELFGQEPDWLRERAGADVHPDMRWVRGVTGLQVLGDLPVSGDTPDRHGHNYHREFIDAWIAVLGLDGSAAPANPYREADGSWITDQVRQDMTEDIFNRLYGPQSPGY